jgi:membrane protein
VWSRLNAVDFMTSSMQFAALAIICLLPFLFLVSAITGGDVRRTIVTRLGLDAQAAHAVDALIYTSNHAISGLSVLGVVFIVFGALGIASTLESWYQRVYEQPAVAGWVRRNLNRGVWIVGMVVYIYLQALVGKIVGPFGGHVLSFVIAFLIAIAFFWWTVHVLLRGRVGWKPLFPSAIATGICVTGLSVFSSLLFSNQIVSSQKSYGPIGVVMVLISYLTGLAVCLHLGAVIGRTWNQRAEPKSPIDSEDAQ